MIEYFTIKKSDNVIHSILNLFKVQRMTKIILLNEKDPQQSMYGSLDHFTEGEGPVRGYLAINIKLPPATNGIGDVTIEN